MSAGRADFKAYELIAVWAGRQAGLNMPRGPEAAKLPDWALSELTRAVAENPKAVKLRDRLYIDFERKLRDPGWTGDQVWNSFQETYGPIGRTSIYRARWALQAKDSKISEVAGIAEAFNRVGQEAGAEGIYKAAGQRAGQLVFSLLMECNAADLGGEMSITRLSAIIQALAKLQTSGYTVSAPNRLFYRSVVLRQALAF